MIKPRIDFGRFNEETDTLAKRTEPKGETVFYGSSTFTLWGHEKLKKDMAPLKVVNRGFGGSTAHDALHFYELLAAPLEPKILVWYEGDNDLECGYTPQEVLEITTTLFDKMRADFPGIKFLVLPVKLSPARMKLWDEFTTYNEIMKEYAASKPDMAITDIMKVTHDGNMKAREDIYIEDGLHFNERGYCLLAEQIKKTLLTLV